MLYGPRSTSTLELSSHVSLSLITVITFKSTSLIRSWITVDTCIHFVNKSPLLSLLPYLNSCTALWTLEENGSWSTSMSRRTDSTGESSFAFCCFVFVLPWSAAPFLFTKVQLTRECRGRGWRFHATDQAILMARSEVCPRLVMPLESSTFSTTWCSQSEINLPAQRGTLCIQCLTARRIHSSYKPCSQETLLI